MNHYRLRNCTHQYGLAALIVCGATVLLLSGTPRPIVAQDLWDEVDRADSSLRNDRDSASRPGVHPCRIELIDEPVLASSEGGLLKNILSEGTEVREGMVVAETDSEDAELAKQAAWFQWQSTLENTDSDIKERYSAANAKVAEAAYRMVVEANKKAARAVSQAEVERREWDWKAGLLAVENEAHERSVMRITAQKEEMDFKRTEAMVRRHSIVSPINGIVVERKRKVGEFVRPGDEVIKVARMDRLKAKGNLPMAELLPHEARGRNVTIEVDLGGETKSFRGQISFVEAEVVTADSGYYVWVEFDNLPNYSIRPGMEGRILLNP